MKTKSTIPAKRRLPEQVLELEGKPFWPLALVDPPDPLPAITRTEITDFSTAYYILKIARADFEALRAALTMKLLRGCPCEESDFFASLDEHNNIVVEDRSSLEPISNRLIIDRETIPSGGLA